MYPIDSTSKRMGFTIYIDPSAFWQGFFLLEASNPVYLLVQGEARLREIAEPPAMPTRNRKSGWCIRPDRRTLLVPLPFP